MRAVAVTFDIADDASVAALVAAAVAEFGGLDAMHANAADLSPETIGQDSNALEVPLDVFMHTIDVNLKGHLLCTRHALPHLLERGGGALVYTSSAAGHIGEPERPSYAASKAGINSLVRHVASHWGRQGIRANSIAPGLVVTPAMDTGLPSDSATTPCASGAHRGWDGPTTSQGWSRSSCPTTASGSTARCSASTAAPACAPDAPLHRFGVSSAP